MKEEWDLNPSMRLKVKGDTFYLPDPEGGVYFRNNTGSFRMEGSMIDQWIEKLIPVFNGEYTMEDLTDGLPDQYRERVYEIAEVLHTNGFVRDVSDDRPHQLPEEIVRKYASQIEFLDSFGGSGAYRFQSYRQSKVLAVGSGPFFVSLVAALLESGLPRFGMLDTDPVTASLSRRRISELAAHARAMDSEVELEEIARKEGGIDWYEAVRPFDAILYVSKENGLAELRALHAACREERKVLLPAVFVQQAGLAGPLVHPDSEGCLESALRRLHLPALRKDPGLHEGSSTAEAMLANVIAFEWLKTASGFKVTELKNQLYLLDLETLEGAWHPFLPHPLVNGRPESTSVEDLELRLEQSPGLKERNAMFPYFGRLASAVTGILHDWEEGDLKQLPLSQCRVQAADPLSEGAAELLPEIVCTGLTHEEARREAGLAGIEAYVSRLFGVGGVGAGETVAEGICRGLHNYLSEELRRFPEAHKSSVIPVRLGIIEDERSRYYLQSLTTMLGAPVVGLGEESAGFPVIWIRAGGRWYGSVGLNRTLALRKALQQALLRAQNKSAASESAAQAASISSLREEQELQSIAIPACEEAQHQEVLLSAMQILKRNHKRLLLSDLACEPFLKEELAGVFGVSLREEESR
ncbi:putative thiazole-containing bacteriocin maturation protein [Paenibacillus sp. sptzw28]|uniref:putative thiazole-containing bacteriocin maturation protein n=1 Tax=Paenibacillus sp. sptzw28 TaxID=715179 RepID=UPI001C6F18C2|nr:putative thiazole-containing bacteriocin maturation protein [Paenibacillus sp. sptzw28]QYR19587.1 putative thiazole-containing bacteriocin maturation protein [Paenibacillus sp. sptzw28]